MLSANVCSKSNKKVHFLINSTTSEHLFIWRVPQLVTIVLPTRIWSFQYACIDTQTFEFQVIQIFDTIYLCVCWKQTVKFRRWSFFIINKLDKKWEECHGTYSKKMITFDVYIRLAIFEFSTLPFTRSLNFKRIRITSQIGIFTSKKLPSKR